MAPKLYIPPLGIAARIANRLMYPIMRLPFIIPWGESPQRTHYWNNIELSLDATDSLDPALMVTSEGDPLAIPRRGKRDTKFHRGGWSRYVVLQPTEQCGDWYVGWIKPNGAGASQIPIKHAVRMLRGPEDTAFFGIRVSDGEQIGIMQSGKGEFGDGSISRRIPLN